MKLANATILITGANRGIGLAFAREALARGARKVYAGARDPARCSFRVSSRCASTSRARRHRCRRGPCSRPHAARSTTPASRTSAVSSPKTPSRPRAAARDQLLRPDAAEPRLRAGARCQRRRRDPQRAVGRKLDQLAAARRLCIDQGRGLVADQRSAPRAARAGHAGSRHAHGLRRHRLRPGRRTCPRSTPESVVRVAFDALERGDEEVLGDDVTHQVKQGLSAQPGVYLQTLAR